ncbi:ADP-heptose:LPS heptosyltransferase [Ulvibacter sp. MAR_2010_11]|uniref:glycosyltransferase family 9 protein n=1 Tax=Ulvibacter sp. MAR_2010_11 TaxID=1250229 RepID=UPI000C2BC36A|nr:glycosyltransferase family 9 protein [Ulvibacter sp. MAR_2010_11]PKA82598.1 ADP-heptose:LPS heptosyltransferase [Ulvibacter sp. MAR_2010_11]
MKNILFLHDTTLATPRGAELTIRELMQLGEQKGHPVILDYLNDFEKTKKHISNANLVILNSTSRCNYELELVDFLINQSVPYVKVEYDYNFCIRRNILCTVDPKVRSCCHPDKFHLFRRLFSGAALNIFQSPKHFEAHRDFYGEAVAKKLIMPPTVDVSKLKPSEEKIENVIPFFGDLNFLKGGHEYVTFAEEHPAIQCKVYGRNRLRREMPKNISFHDPVSNAEVLEILGKTKRFICKPVWPEPSGRLAAEAFLSGCEMITNDRVGTFSFDFYPENKKQAYTEMQQAPEAFWKAVESILSTSEADKKAKKLGKVLVYKSYGGLGDIFFAIPAIYKLAEVSESLHFAVAPRLVDFFTKHLTVKVVNEKEVREQEENYDHIYELGNYPAFRGYDLPHALKYPTHKKVKQHAIQHYIDTIAKLHVDIDNRLEGYPYFKAEKDSKNPYFVVHHGAGFLLKIWPTKKYAQLIERLADIYPNLDCKIIMGPDDPDIAQYFTKEMPHVEFITGGMLDVGEAMAGALFHIGNDAGITHVAGSFNVPSVGIYGPTGPGSWGSFAQHNDLIWGKQGVCAIRCNYDVILSCEHKICLNSVTVDRVLEALYKVIQKAYPEQPAVLKVNPQAAFEFTEKDCLVKLGENELLLEYHSPDMRKNVEALLMRKEETISSEADVKMVVDVLKQQHILFEVATFQ